MLPKSLLLRTVAH